MNKKIWNEALNESSNDALLKKLKPGALFTVTSGSQQFHSEVDYVENNKVYFTVDDDIYHTKLSDIKVIGNKLIFTDYDG